MSLIYNKTTTKYNSPMKPSLNKFKETMTVTRGNLSRTAKLFGVDRTTVYEWVWKDKQFEQVLNEARMRLFDDCLLTAEVVSLGIPEKDEKGVVIGWRERPDGNMLRYLMGTLGRKEGFGERQEIDLNNNITSIAKPEDAATFLKTFINECRE